MRSSSAAVTAAGSPPPATEPSMTIRCGSIIGSFQEQVDAAHQVPDHPFHQALAGHIELHAQCVTRVVALPEPGLRLDALAGAELVHDEHGGPGSCPRHPEVL